MPLRATAVAAATTRTIYFSFNIISLLYSLSLSLSLSLSFFLSLSLSLTSSPLACPRCRRFRHRPSSAPCTNTGSSRESTRTCRHPRSAGEERKDRRKRTEGGYGRNCESVSAGTKSVPWMYMSMNTHSDIKSIGRGKAEQRRIRERGKRERERERERKGGGECRAWDQRAFAG